MAKLPDYAELHCLSCFSFLRGASQPAELIAQARLRGYGALAITDECSVAGVVQAWQAIRDLHADDAREAKAAAEAGLPVPEFLPMPKLIVGSEFVLDDGLKLVLLAQNREGYGNLSALITLARRRAEKGAYQLTRGDLTAIMPCGAVPDCLALWVPGEPLNEEPSEADARWLAERFPQRLWIAAELLCGPDDAARLAALQALGAACKLPLVAAGDVHMHARGRRPLQDTLTAIRLRTTVFEAGHGLFPNGERHLRTRMRLARLYPPALLAETQRIAALCNFELGELRYEYPDEIVPSGHTLASYLRQETEAGLVRRYPNGIPAKVRADVEKELALIAEKRYEAFFLTVYDIVLYARSQGILCQGRGSAANSVVCYALGITAVDPMRAKLLFERFISRERDEPPDIDVDFEHERREEVIQYIYRKYGRERAALAATVIRYRRRSALRDVGLALGFGEEQIAALSNSLAWWDKRDELPARLVAIGMRPDSPRVQKWLALTDAIRTFPRHLSQHVGGFVISQGPLSRLVPVENAAMADRSVIQWDKDDLESLGLLKVDVLALGMLTVIRKALALIAERRGLAAMSMNDIPPKDVATFDMICKADTVGVFQIESRAQMSMLPRLKPREFYDLVVQVAIVRPGPIQGGMVHPFLKGHAEKKPVQQISPEVDAVLARTWGVPIFQEQVMQLAVVAAGFTPGEADQLRRAMASWKQKGHLERFKDKLRAGMAAKGLSEFAEALCRQIEGFGEYGFPESHAASFALLAYVSSWIKCHEPEAFLCALLDSQPMGFYAPAQLLQDARRHGVEVLPVDVMESELICTLVTPRRRSRPSTGSGQAGLGPSGNPESLSADESRWIPAFAGTTDKGRPAVRLGLLQVGGLHADAAQAIVAARAQAPFRDVQDLALRAQLDTGQLRRLAEADALASLAGHRRQATWQVSGVQLRGMQQGAAKKSGKPVQGDLFDSTPAPEAAVTLAAPPMGESLVADYASLGLSLRPHPLSLLRARLAERRFLPAAVIQAAGDRALMRAAGIVTCRQKPGSAKSVFVTLEDETGMLNVIVQPWLAERQRRELLGARLLGVYGQLQSESGVVHLMAKRLVDLTPWLGRLDTSSRDFH